MKAKVKHIALILEDTLQALGLQTLLADYFAPVEVERYGSMDEFNQTHPGTAEMFDYYVMSAADFALHSEACLHRKTRTILVSGYGDHTRHPMLLDVRCTQEEILCKLGGILNRQELSAPKAEEETRELTPREAEVLRLVVLGKINKEIADELTISFQTVLSHRKNITAKLGIKTVSGLTFYALTYGIVKPEEIRH